MEQCALNGVAAGMIVLGGFALLGFIVWCAFKYLKWVQR